MEKFIFDEQIFQSTFIVGNELRNKGKASDGCDSIMPFSSDKGNKFASYSTNDLMADVIRSAFGVKINSKKPISVDEIIEQHVDSLVSLDTKDRFILVAILEDLNGKSISGATNSLPLYRFWGSNDNRDIGKFVYDVIFSEKNRNELKGIISTNLLDKLLNEIYEKGKVLQNENKDSTFAALYKERFSALFSHMEEDIQKALELGDSNVGELAFLVNYYMFIYLSQVVMTFDNDIDYKIKDEPEYLLFRVGKEHVGEDRECISRGWRRLEKKNSKLFAHLILLNMLNEHDNSTPFYSYSDIYRIYEKAQPEEQIFIEKCIDFLIRKYTIDYQYLDDQGNNVVFNSEPEGQSGDVTFLISKIKYLFNCIQHQLDSKSSRSSVRVYVKNSFETLLKMRFVRSWSSYGNMISISYEDLLMLIQICERSSEHMIKNRGIQINDLFSELESRGLALDKRSQKHIVDYLFEIDLIDSKSDSEEAQYVKPIG